MWDIDLICDLTGLTEEKCFFIMKNFMKLKEELNGLERLNLQLKTAETKTERKELLKLLKNLKEKGILK